MRTYLFILTLLFTLCHAANARTFDLTKAQPRYSSEVGYGYDYAESPTAKSSNPFYFSVKLPDGNYRVTVVLGSKKRAAETVVRAESRRLLLENCATRKGQFAAFTFVVNKRCVDYVAANGKEGKVRINAREIGSMTWDEKLTLEFTGKAPAVKEITIEEATNATTLFLCGNSTVVDQAQEPWASWGQIFPRWFKDNICVANFGESGLTATSFMNQNRLEKIITMLKPGDYVFCEFGHNDEKEKGPGTGPWYHYSVVLKKFVDIVRAKGGNVIFCTPTQRRNFHKDGKTVISTHGEFPAAMRTVAQRENVPLIELTDATTALYAAMGVEDSKRLLVHYNMGDFDWLQKPLADNTHFNPFGAYEVSKCVVMGLKAMKSPLVDSLRDDWQDFSPSQPDDWTKFYWPQSIFNDIRKPEGN